MSDAQYYRRGGRFALSQITPLTYRDGETYVSLLWRLFTHIREELHPSLETAFDDLIDQLESQMGHAEQQFVDGVQEFQRIHDQFMDDVEASLKALNDTVVADLVDNGDSYLGSKLRDIFLKVESADDTVADYLRDENSATRTVVETLLESIDLSDDLEEFKDSIKDIEKTTGQQIDDGFKRVQKTVDDIYSKAMVGADTDLIHRLTTGNAVIVFVGSSTTRLHEYPGEVARHIHGQFHSGIFERIDDITKPLPKGTHVINAGWGGSSGADYVYDELADKISALNPSMIIHGIGSNDWRHGRDPKQLGVQIEQAIGKIHSNTTIHHVLMHQHERLNGSNKYDWDDYLDVLYEVANNGENRTVVDASDEMRKAGVGKGLNDRMGLLKSDGVHLTSEGNKLLGNIVARKMGLHAAGGVTDTGWQHLSGYVKYHPNTGAGVNEPPHIRIVRDGGGTTTYIRGIITRSSDAGAFFTLNQEIRDMVLPEHSKVYGENERFIVGWYYTVTDNKVGPIFLRSNGNVIRSQSHGIGTSSAFVDIIIRGGA